MSCQAHSRKQKYMRLATVFLVVSKLFGKMKNMAPLNPWPDDFWPRDKTFKDRFRRKTTGFDVFARNMYKKLRIGESPLDQYTRISRAWHHKLDAGTKERYEAEAQSHNSGSNK